MKVEFPRVIIAGLAGDTGKSLVSLGMIRALRKRGLEVAPFKKGPDFIDAAWLGEAAGVSGRNLDNFLMSEETILESLSRASNRADIAVIEGNRGLFDGMDARGSHSTAQLSRMTGTPVILVVDSTKSTRTIAALLLGCQNLEPDLALVGVILNRVGTARQEAVIREAVKIETGLPILGAIRRLKIDHLPSRHLGLVTPSERSDACEALETLGEAISDFVDLEAVLKLAGAAHKIEEPKKINNAENERQAPVRIGVLKDPAFSFYYPENIEALQEAGAELTFISPMGDEKLPTIDALYAGGGFPEEYAGDISANRPFMSDLKRRIFEGLPVWAECGGLMYLSKDLKIGDKVHPMVGALPVSVEQTSKPQGHGYVEVIVKGTNPFLPEDLHFRGHEFHYSRLRDDRLKIDTVLELSRGVGVGGGRDGIRSKNVMASYTHIHALGMPEFASGLVTAARTAAA
jgi:cobyrinic acid a,c-diamide synthase